MVCDHTGTHSGASRYLHESGQLRLVLVCDQCGAECNELTRFDYRPVRRHECVAEPTAREAGFSESGV